MVYSNQIGRYKYRITGGAVYSVGILWDLELLLAKLIVAFNSDLLLHIVDLHVVDFSAPRALDFVCVISVL